MIGLANSQQGIARGKLIVILFAVAIIAVGCSALIFSKHGEQKAVQQRSVSNPNGYRDTADQFMKALTQNKPDVTYNLMTEAGRKNVGGFEAWQTMINNSFAQSKTEPTFVSALDIQGADATYKTKEPRLLTYRLQLFNADWETSLTILKDGDTWKVDNIVTEPK